MKNKLTILGCGSSLGTPWITKNFGNCDSKNKKNIRTRCCAHIQYKNISILLDTSPDIKFQFINNNLKNIDAVLYTHEHADQTSGIFELRPFYWKNKKKIPVYSNKRTIKELRNKYTYCFKALQGYRPIMTTNIIKNKFTIKKNSNTLVFNEFEVKHGLINASGYLFNGVAYLSDCNHIPKDSLKYLKGLKYLIVDCLRVKKHPSHFNLEDVKKLVSLIKPKKTILTNLHVDLDYEKLKQKLPKNIIPAYDGLNINF